MNILDEIVIHKQKEIEERKSLYPVKLLEQRLYFASPIVSLRNYLRRPDKSGIIAEIKRKSPSRGVINPHVSVERTSIGYMQAGASALSVLTDSHFFGGSTDDLTTARKFNFCPILRKDFVLDEYQIIEAKSMGADAILLIAAILPPARVRALATVAHTLGLEVLLEVHTRDEVLQNLESGVDLMGVNNRDLKTFTVNVSRSYELATIIPAEVVKISESGIDTPATIHALKNAGFEGFLIGQTFMQHSRPEQACRAFIQELKRLTQPVTA